MKKRRYLIIVLVLLIALLCSNLSSCAGYRSKYDFLHDESDIVAIEIVVADIDLEVEEDGTRFVPKQTVLVAIDDTEAFMERLKKIEYRDFLYNGSVDGIIHRDLAIKISYNNGDYELLNCWRNSYQKNGGAYYCVSFMGYFDEEDFSELMNEYLAKQPSQSFDYMHKRSSAVKAEIAEIAHKHDVDIHNVITEISDLDSFLNEFEAVPYQHIYKTDYEKGEKENDRVIKITYDNGDWEIISSVYRFHKRAIWDQSDQVYVGEFDTECFDALILKYSS